ncbi:MAG: hypothetical protein ACOX0N_00200 [Syntrophomonadaceae bacterium]|jgi:hypothetical protein|nr:hypothetical protein [Syntrophomonadaceae bacterium]
MRNYKKMFIGLIVLVNLILAVGIYTHYQLNNREMLSNPEMLSSNQGDQSPTSEDDSLSTDSSSPGNYQDESQEQTNKSWWKSLLNRLTHSQVDNPPQGKTSNPEDMVKLAEKQLGRPVDKADVAQVAAILLKRLDSEELSFIYQQMTKEGKPSSAEIKKAKQILQNKLTPEELELVQEVALKYGKKINF